MAVDTPATIAILGGGPMGIEAGLYGRFLGYDVVILEAQDVAAHVRSWGHVRMFSPFRQLCSTLGLAALRAQDPDLRVPDPDAQLTGRQWVEHYIQPLSQSDLLADHVQCLTRVVAVGRQHLRKSDPQHDEERGDDGFRLLLQLADGRHIQQLADVVIDCTGVYGHPGWCGAGGIPARGELQSRHRIEHGTPDMLGGQRSHYEGRRILLLGNDLTAAATLAGLMKLAERSADTRVTWAVHHPLETEGDAPIPVEHYRQLPAREQLVAQANQYARSGGPGLAFRPNACVDAVEYDPELDEFVVQFEGDTTVERFDRVIANVGYRPDRSLYEELRVSDSPQFGSPRPPAQAGDTAGERLATDEPNFYVLGSKAYGRAPGFLMADGLRQIRDLFGLIGGRAELDLYATAAKLIP
jgi:hypothetical protein